MLVVCDKLDEATGTLLERLAGGGDNFEVYSGGGVGVEDVNFPGGGLAYPDFSITDAGGFFGSRDGMANKAGDFELFCCLCSRLGCY